MLYAEQQYFEGWRFPARRAESVAHLDAARAAFPFTRYVRHGTADFYAVHRWKGSRPAAISAIERALRDDPWAPDLHRNLAGFLYEAGDHAGAARELAILNRISPGRKQAIVVNANPATN